MRRPHQALKKQILSVAKGDRSRNFQAWMLKNISYIQKVNLHASSNTYCMKPSLYLNNLTPLRGIAAILTVIFHANQFLSGALVTEKFAPMMERLYLMVDFFFILSGFIMCHVYANYFTDKVSSNAFKKFSIARFARVYPLHLITLVYLIAMYGISRQAGVPEIPILEVENSKYSIFTNLLLLHSMNLHQWFTWVHASWSISTEWWAYMIFPFLVKPMNRAGNMGKAAIALSCLIGYFLIAYFVTPVVTSPKEFGFPPDTSHTSLNVSYQFGYLRCLCGFVLGMSIYHAYLAGWGKKILSNGYVMILLGLGVFLSMQFFISDVLVVAFFPFILLSGAYGGTGIDRFFAARPLQRLGDWSFYIYLVHQPVLITLVNIFTYLNPPKPGEQPPPLPLQTAWLVTLVVIALVLLLSYLTYRFWELPARKWINAKFGKQWAPVSARS